MERQSSGEFVNGSDSVEHYTLDNGLRVIMIERDEIEGVAAVGMVGAGESM
ncbi:MAG: hypothetical protein GY869_11965 [Planctomycetes bacterium]|nr:hypothetical protein [Planctomycetota bacterium]